MASVAAVERAMFDTEGAVARVIVVFVVAVAVVAVVAVVVVVFVTVVVAVFKTFLWTRFETRWTGTFSECLR